MCNPLTQNDQIRHGNQYGEERFYEVIHANSFAQMGRSVKFVSESSFLYCNLYDCPLKSIHLLICF